MRKFGIVMMVLQIITTVFLFPLFFIGGPVIWFFWWVAFISPKFALSKSVTH